MATSPMRVPRAATAARIAAIVIAIAATVDPSWSSTRQTRPVVSVVASDSAHRSLADIVEQQLRAQYTVVPAALGAASGTVVVGNALPRDLSEVASPVVAFSDHVSSGAHLSLLRVQAPSVAALESRAPISATVRVTRLASAARIHAQLRTNGYIVADARVAITRDTTVALSLAFAPVTAEPAVVQVVTWLDDVARTATDTLRHDVMIDVRTTRHTVLFFDRRPSWMSTFVRRALERDPRFAVTSRVVTSITPSASVSRQSGAAPTDLAAIAASTSASDAFDAIVIGAPDALTARDVDGVRTLLRERGASVLLLADHAAAGPIDALIGANGWRTVARRSAARITDAVAASVASQSAIVLSATSIGVPATLPASADVIATLVDSTNLAHSQPVIWRQSVGLGTLVVSGAFDAWRFRDPAQSTFDATWRDLIDDAVARRLAPIDVQLSSALAEPREPLALRVAVRDTIATLSAVLRPLTDTLIGTRSDTIALAADASGQRTAIIRAPARLGMYQLVVYQRGARTTDSAVAPIVVAANVARDASANADVLSAFVAARGGAVLDASDTRALRDDLARRIAPSAHLITWYPMRSPWWIMVFALLLSVEWWLRRRHGRP